MTRRGRLAAVLWFLPPDLHEVKEIKQARFFGGRAFSFILILDITLSNYL
jgi:hypothetical protein